MNLLSTCTLYFHSSITEQLPESDDDDVPDGRGV